MRRLAPQAFGRGVGSDGRESPRLRGSQLHTVVGQDHRIGSQGSVAVTVLMGLPQGIDNLDAVT